MSNHPVLSRLGIARRAGLLVVGTEKVTAALKSKKARLVVIASDISQKTEKSNFKLAKNRPLCSAIFIKLRICRNCRLTLSLKKDMI